MNYQVYVHTSKTQNEDGFWTVQVIVTNEIPDESQTDGYRTEVLRTSEYRSQVEPQIEHLDFT